MLEALESSPLLEYRVVSSEGGRRRHHHAQYQGRKLEACNDVVSTLVLLKISIFLASFSEHLSNKGIGSLRRTAAADELYVLRPRWRATTHTG